MCGVCCEQKPAGCPLTSPTFVPTPAAKEIRFVGMAGRWQILPGLQSSWHPACAANPSPLALGGALHLHILLWELPGPAHSGADDTFGLHAAFCNL